MNPNVYDLTVAAEKQLATYRHPKMNEWIMAIDPILKAAGEMVIGNDLVNAIDFSEADDELHIGTSYAVLSCEQANNMYLPVAILKAENPIVAANRYRLGKALAEAKKRIDSAQRTLAEFTEKAAAIQSELLLYDALFHESETVVDAPS